MDEVEIDFADASTQVFHVGEASVAVPGLLRGLQEAHERRGRLPWATLFVPAVELADRPFAATEAQAFLHEILTPILEREPGGQRVYGTAGVIDARDILPTLRLLRDARSEALALLLPELAGDLDAYRVEERRPLEAVFAGASVMMTPAPSLGGAVVQTGLAALNARDRGAPGSPDEALALAAALAAAVPPRAPVQARARPARPTSRWSTRTAPRWACPPRSARGRAFSATASSSTTCSASSTSSASRRARRWRGSRARRRRPSSSGRRESRDSSPEVPARVRLAGAILQVVEAVVGHGLAVAEAISRPRLHVDDGTVHVEGGWTDDVAPRSPRTGSTSGAGRTGTCFSAASRRSSAVRVAFSVQQAIRGAAGTGSSYRIAIRPAEPTDASELVALAADVGREAGDWLLATETWRPVADERRYLKAVRRHADAAVFVAVDGDRIVGRLSLARDPHPASSHVADLGLMVAASHRRRGIGRALLDTAVEWARMVGVSKLELHVFPWNDPAIRLYEGFGFEREGLRRGHFLRDGVAVDAILMAYHLSSEREFPPSPGP